VYRSCCANSPADWPPAGSLALQGGIESNRIEKRKPGRGIEAETREGKRDEFVKGKGRTVLYCKRQTKSTDEDREVMGAAGADMTSNYHGSSDNQRQRCEQTNAGWHV